MEAEMTDQKQDSPAVVVVCQCRSTDFTIKRTTGTSVALVCSKCGLAASVKASVAEARLPDGLLLAAVDKHLTHPEPQPEKPEPEGPKWMTLRFRIHPDQDEVIRRSMEAVRIMNNGDEAFRVQQWQGSALEFICADFLSGVDPRVLEAVDAIKEAEEEAAEKYTESKGKPYPASTARKLRNKMRDTLAASIGSQPIEQAPHVDEALIESMRDREQAMREKEEAAAADDRIEDDGALRKSVLAAAMAYRASHKELTGGDVDFLIGLSPEKIKPKWQKSGGHLIRIVGDARTRTASGQTPVCWCWISEDSSVANMDIDVEYEDEIGGLIPDPALVVVECLPAGYSELPDEDKWDAPSFASEREELR